MFHFLFLVAVENTGLGDFSTFAATLGFGDSQSRRHGLGAFESRGRAERQTGRWSEDQMFFALGPTTRVETTYPPRN